MSKPSGPLAPEHLQCEHRVDPLGIDEPRPRLSWWVRDDRPGAVQSACQVVVATDPARLDAPDLWDSGTVQTPESACFVYAGPALRSRHRCVWRVRTWDGDGNVSPWSAQAVWEMGLLDANDWSGQWIGLPAPGDDSQPCPFVRRDLTLNAPVRRARLYATARGLVRFEINGRRVGDEEFIPGWTDYARRIQVVTWDVTDLLTAGSNALGAILGDGWFCGNIGWVGHRGVYGKIPSLLAQLEVELADGSTVTVATDDVWNATTGPIRASDIYNGETVDARLAMPGWSSPGFDASAWQTATIIDPPAARLVAKHVQPVRPIEELTPLSLSQPQPGRFVFDLGQNMVGRVRLRLRSQPAGQTVTLRHAEMLEADGTLYTANLRGAKATDVYICRGDAEEVYEPYFTFHGFRYVEVSGLEGQPRPEDVAGVVLHSDLPETGQFECSDPQINRLQANIRWGQKGNFLEVPTDCPQRDERLGWTGDAQVFVRTASFNMDVAAFFEKWAFDLADAQAPDGSLPHVAPDVLSRPGRYHGGTAAWADAGVICPWTIYLTTGDRRILEQAYPMMAGWIEHQRATSDRLIRPDAGFGDWLATDAVTPGAAPTPRDLIGTAYFAHTTDLMARIAALLGRDGDAASWRSLHQEIVAAFNREFVSPAGRVVGHTQTGYLLALAFDLLPDALQPAAVRHLVHLIESRGNKLTTGFVGTPLLCPVLTRFGRADVAYRLLMQTEYPSWLYTVAQGATTMWERWNSFTLEKGFGDAGMNSFNHYAYGAIGQWLYASVAGIDLDEAQPGYRHVVIRPHVGGGLTWARGQLATPYGLVRSGWTLEGETLTLEVAIPANAHATVLLPAASPDAVSLNGDPLPDAVAEPTGDGRVAVGVGSGSYRFDVPVTPAVAQPAD